MQVRSKEYWNQRYIEEKTGWDLGEPSTPLTAYFQQLVDKDISILIPGGGSNYEAEYAYNLGFPNVNVLDVSEEALERFLKRCPQFPKDQVHIGDFFDHQGQYDLILEQTFFCAIDYHLRPKYAAKMSELLKPGGMLSGLWFDFPLTTAKDDPPLGGSLEEYKEYFDPFFEIKTFERCYNSMTDRDGIELFAIMKKKQ